MRQPPTRSQSADMITLLIGVAVFAVAATITFIVWALIYLLVSPEQAKRFSDWVDTLIDHLPPFLRPA